MHAWPPDTSRRYLKRVVGLPGDTIAMAKGVLLVNGRRVVEPYAWHADSTPAQPVPEMSWMREFSVVSAQRHQNRAATRNDWGPIVVPPDAWFVLGDNRDSSLDSRYWGFVSAGQLLGRVVPRSAP